MSAFCAFSHSAKGIGAHLKKAGDRSVFQNDFWISDVQKQRYTDHQASIRTSVTRPGLRGRHDGRLEGGQRPANSLYRTLRTKKPLGFSKFHPTNQRPDTTRKANSIIEFTAELINDE